MDGLLGWHLMGYAVLGCAVITGAVQARRMRLIIKSAQQDHRHQLVVETAVALFFIGFFAAVGLALAR